jgi:hypothetical protein
MIRLALRSFWRHCFVAITEADNRTPSLFRVAGLALSVFMAVTSGYATFVHGHLFDASGFGVGVASLWAAVGIGERVAHYIGHDPQAKEG